MITRVQITRVVELARRIAQYSENVRVAEQRHEYNLALDLHGEMLQTIGFFMSYLQHLQPAEALTLDLPALQPPGERTG